MTTDLSILELVRDASLLVQLVMLSLVLASVISWTVIFRKWGALRDARIAAEAFEDELGRSGVGGPSISLEEMDKMGICKCFTSIKDPGAVCFGTWKKGSMAPDYTRRRKY